MKLLEISTINKLNIFIKIPVNEFKYFELSIFFFKNRNKK